MRIIYITGLFLVSMAVSLATTASDRDEHQFATQTTRNIAGTRYTVEETPSEGWWGVFQFVPLEDFLRLPLIGKYFHNLSQQPSMWSGRLPHINRQQLLLLTSLNPPVPVTMLSSDLEEGLEKQDLTRLQQLPFLHYLTLNQCNLQLDHLQFLAQLPILTYLDVGKSLLGNEGVKYLLSLTNLQTLKIPAIGINDERLPDIKTLKNLKVLDISHNGISDKGIEELKTHFPKLSLKADMESRCIIHLHNVLINPGHLYFKGPLDLYVGMITNPGSIPGSINVDGDLKLQARCDMGTSGVNIYASGSLEMG